MPALPPDRPGCPKAPGGRRPLPDPAAIRLYLVPDPAPPYDEEVAAAGLAAAGFAGAASAAEPDGLPGWPPRAAGPVEPGPVDPGAVATESRASAGRPPVVSAQEGGRRGHGTEHRHPAATEYRERAGAEGRDGPRGRAGIRGVRRPPAAAPGTPPGWADRFAQALAEALAGSRPPRQLVPWTTQEAMDRIQRLGPRLASAQRPVVRRVVTSRPAPDVLEMTVVVGFGPRVKAVAVRLERAGACPPARRGDRAADGWVCTAVEAA